jgi:osmotically-inducible protein OsmY
MLQRLAPSVAVIILTVACGQSDPGITTAVKTKLAADDTVNGTVATKAEADRAVSLARDTNGVKSVVNNLRIGR